MTVFDNKVVSKQYSFVLDTTCSWCYVLKYKPKEINFNRRTEHFALFFLPNLYSLTEPKWEAEGRTLLWGLRPHGPQKLNFIWFKIEEVLNLSFTCMQTLQQITRQEKTTNQPYYYHKKEKPLTVTGVECRDVRWIADGDPSALEKSPSSLGSLVGFWSLRQQSGNQSLEFWGWRHVESL